MGLILSAMAFTIALVISTLPRPSAKALQVGEGVSIKRVEVTRSNVIYAPNRVVWSVAKAFRNLGVETPSEITSYSHFPKVTNGYLWVFFNAPLNSNAWCVLIYTNRNHNFSRRELGWFQRSTNLWSLFVILPEDMGASPLSFKQSTGEPLFSIEVDL